MWLRLTERARKAVALAGDDLRLSPDLLVLACVSEKGGVTAKALAELNVEIDDLLQKLEAITPDTGTEDDEIVDMAEQEARTIGSPYIGSEHLLLGIIRNGKCQGAQILRDAGADYASVVKVLRSMNTAKKRDEY